MLPLFQSKWKTFFSVVPITYHLSKFFPGEFVHICLLAPFGNLWKLYIGKLAHSDHFGSWLSDPRLTDLEGIIHPYIKLILKRGMVSFSSQN